jgi:hypothetical protein
MQPTQRKWQFDWKQMGDYLLGRSMFIGIADDAADNLSLCYLARHARFHHGCLW